MLHLYHQYRCARTVDYAAARKYAGIFRDGMYAGLWRYSLYTASRIFAPIGEAKIAENKTGAAMALGSFIGYAPAMFCFSLYGYILDLNPGIIGYKIVFGIMACFAFCGAVVSVMLVKRISQRKKEMLAAEA